MKKTNYIRSKIHTLRSALTKAIYTPLSSLFQRKSHLKKVLLYTSPIALVCIVLVGAFMLTSPSYPHTSELAFIEHSPFGEGSVVPASCSSVPPTSHVNGDCTYTCPGGRGSYDPVFDAGQIACPKPTVSTWPSLYVRVSYAGFFPFLGYGSTFASKCQLYSSSAGGPYYTHPIGTPTGYSYPTYGPFMNSIKFAVECWNGGSGSTWGYFTIDPCPASSPIFNGTSCVAPTVNVNFQ